MPKKRPIMLDDYGIDKNRYLELKYLCLQYNKLKLRSTGSDAAAEAAAVKCKIIEDCCKEASGDIYDALMKNITQGVTYEHMQVFSGRRQFYEKRRKFFWLLDKKGNTGDVLI